MTEFALPIPDEWLEAIAERAAELVLERTPRQQLQLWFNIAEAAEYLRCTKQHVYDLRSDGRLTCYSEGGRALVSRTELDGLVVDTPTGRPLAARANGASR